MKNTGIVMIAVMLGGAAQAKVDLVTVPARDTVQLTIYNQEDLTLVREQRALTLIAEHPIQIGFYITGCRSVGIHVQGPADGIRTLGNALNVIPDNMQNRCYTVLLGEPDLSPGHLPAGIGDIHRAVEQGRDAGTGAAAADRHPYLAVNSFVSLGPRHDCYGHAVRTAILEQGSLAVRGGNR